MNINDRVYRKVDVLKYLSNGIQNGTLKPFLAKKTARVKARRGVLDEVVVTYTSGGLVEKVNKVEIDPATGNTGWILTKIDENNNVVIDDFGHVNEWIISDSSFVSEYQYIPDSDDIYVSIDKNQLFVRIHEDIEIEHDGEIMKISTGGFLNITNLDNVYGISFRDFYDTYKILVEQPKMKL